MKPVRAKAELDEISLGQFQCDAIIGVYPSERKKPQKIIVDLTLYMDLRQAAMEKDIQKTIDYGWLAAETAFILKAGQFKLLETAAEVLARHFLAPPIQSLRKEPVYYIEVSLFKPAVFEEKGNARIKIKRTHTDYSYIQEKTAFGCVDITFENKYVGLYRLRVAPGCSIPLHIHKKMYECEMVLTEGLHLQNKPVSPGYMRQWPSDFPHKYENPTDQEQVILCLDKPKFSQIEEIAVDMENHPDLDDVPSTKLYIK